MQSINVQQSEWNKEIKLWWSCRLLQTKCYCTPHRMVLLQKIKDSQRAERVRDASELLHHIVVRKSGEQTSDRM